MDCLQEMILRKTTLVTVNHHNNQSTHEDDGDDDDVYRMGLEEHCVLRTPSANKTLNSDMHWWAMDNVFQP